MIKIKMRLEVDDEGRMVWLDGKMVMEFRELVIKFLTHHLRKMRSASDVERRQATDCLLRLGDLLDCFRDGKLVVGHKEVADTWLEHVEWAADFFYSRLVTDPRAQVDAYRREVYTAFRYYSGLHELICECYEGLPG